MVLQTIPYKAPTVECRRVAFLHLQDLVEVIKREGQSVPAYLLPDRAQVVQRGDIILLQLTRLQVVVLSLVELILLIVAEGSIIEGLEMLGVELNCSGVIVNSFLVVAILAVRETPIMVEISLATFKVYRDRKAFDSFVKFTHSVQGNTLVVVSESVLGLYFYGCTVVLDCLLELRQFVIRETSVEQSFEMIRVNFQSLRVE